MNMKDATLAVVTAASQLGEVHALVIGSGCASVGEQAAKVAGVATVHVADDAALANQLAENAAPLIASLMESHDAFLAPATTTGKNIAPRVAALLDVMQISDILSVESEDTFTRPIYAGNAIATVTTSDAKKVITVRGTAFDKAATEGGSASIEAVGGASDAGLSTFVSEEIAKSERPELTTAKIIVSGGRALGSSEKFEEVITPLADKLGAGIGAITRRSRRRLRSQRLSGRPDRQDRRPRTLYRCRYLRRDPASCRHEGFQGDCGNQQGRRRSHLPGSRLRPGS